MPVTEVDDTTSPKLDTSVLIRLRLEVYDPIAIAKGYRTVKEQADWHGLHRSHMHALRNGDSVPRLDTAMGVAADCGIPVESLWGVA